MIKAAKLKFLQKIEIDRRVHFLGFRNDVDRILKTCDIVVLSSNWEGLSLASYRGTGIRKAVCC
ncbi:glycosyltransferase [Vulcanibacillus modesticaldus]|uniref:glycosyltransferase n=1 Tax=Vulcanibacillus modesticaldus TaxID=337097 RepID=UPI003CCC4255